MSISLFTARKLARVKTHSYLDENAPGVHYIAWEGNSDIFVHIVNDKQALANLLLDYSTHRSAGGKLSLVEFGGRRGFNMKKRKSQEGAKKHYGPYDVVTEID